MAPLRVLQVTPQYFPSMGGVEQHVHQVSYRLAAAGVKVTILTTDARRDLPPWEEDKGIQIWRLPAWPAGSDLFFAPEIFKLVWELPWDIVHCQSIHTLVPPLAMLAALQAKRPYLVTFHTGGHSSQLRNRLRIAQWWAQRPLLKRARKLIGVSNFEASLFQKSLRLPPDLFTVIPNGSQMPEVIASSNSQPQEKLILSVGRLERYKGHHRVIAALPRVREHLPGVRLRVVGSGPYEEKLRQLARKLGVADQVEIGSIPPGDGQKMGAALSQADLVTLLSEYEAHPISVMEALALGRQVLVADTSGLSELAQQGLVRAIPLDSSPDQVAAAIVKSLSQPIAPKELRLPTWDDCAGALLNLYQACLRSPACAS